jgi:hypothetical protein
VSSAKLSIDISAHATGFRVWKPGKAADSLAAAPNRRRANCKLGCNRLLWTEMNDYNITIRIDDYGLHVCHAANLKREFEPGRMIYNEPVESVAVELNKPEQNMIYRCRETCPVFTRQLFDRSK